VPPSGARQGDCGPPCHFWEKVYNALIDTEGNTMESECEMCGTLNEPMGSLGALTHYKCRDCGWVYSADVEEDEDE